MEKIPLPLPADKTRFPHRPTRSLVTILTELSRLLTRRKLTDFCIFNFGLFVGNGRSNFSRSQFLLKCDFHSLSPSLLLCRIFEKLFSPKNWQTASVDPPRLLFSNLREGLFPSAKRPEVWSSSITPSIVKVKNVWSYISTSSPQGQICLLLATLILRLCPECWCFT